MNWTVESFAHRFLGDKPVTEAALLVATDGEGLSERKAKRFLSVGIERGLVHRWTFTNPNTPHRFATAPQPVTATVIPSGTEAR